MKQIGPPRLGVLATQSLLTVFCLHATLVSAAAFDPFGVPGQPQGDESLSDPSPRIPEMQFTNHELSMVFQIVSDATGWSIFPSREVNQAKVSLWVKDLSAQQLLDQVVAMAGFVYHRDGNVITVMTYDEYLQHYGLERKVITIVHANADAIANTIEPFLSKLGKKVVHADTGTIVLYETEANLAFITGIVESLDIPREDIVIAVVDLHYAEAEGLARVLAEVFGASQRITGSLPPAPTAKPNKKAPAKPMKEGGGPDRGSVLDPVTVLAIEHANQILLVGTQSGIEQVREVIARVDVFGSNLVVEVIALEFADAELIADTLREMFSQERSNQNRDNGSSSTAKTNRASSPDADAPALTPGMFQSPLDNIDVQAISRTNQLIIKAAKGDVERMRQLVSRLDIYVEPMTQAYQFIYVDATELYTGLERILNISTRSGSSGGRRGGQGDNERTRQRGGLTLVERNNSIVVTGPPSVHRITQSIVDTVDKPGAYEAGMIRVYKIENADVEEVAQTVRELITVTEEADTESSRVRFSDDGSTGDTAPPAGDAALAATEEFVPQGDAGGRLPAPPTRWWLGSPTPVPRPGGQTLLLRRARHHRPAARYPRCCRRWRI